MSGPNSSWIFDVQYRLPVEAMRPFGLLIATIVLPANAWVWLVGVAMVLSRASRVSTWLMAGVGVGVCAKVGVVRESRRKLGASTLARSHGEKRALFIWKTFSARIVLYRSGSRTEPDEACHWYSEG